MSPHVLLRSVGLEVLCCIRSELTLRENEAAFLEKLGEGIAKGTAWERITELLALENSREPADHL